MNNNNRMGFETAKIAEGIREIIPTDFKIFYDHGDSSSESVCACKGVLGNTISNATRIADVDIVITNGSKIKYIIEIEESGTISAKKLLGDYFAMLFIDSIFLKDNQCKIIDKETNMVIAGLVNPKGNSLEKIKKIEDKITELNIEKKINIVLDKDIEGIKNKIFGFISQTDT